MRRREASAGAPGITLLGALVISCAASGQTSAPQGPPLAPPGTPELAAVSPPVDVTEVCENAYDDNDNGFINEGCNEPQGELHVVITWQGRSEIDLFVFDPSGAVAPVGATSALGLSRTQDCPGQGSTCQGNQRESVVLDGEELAPGRYRIVVRAVDLGAPRVDVELGVRSPEGTRAYRASFFRSETEVTLELEVPQVPGGPTSGGAAQAAASD
ncbi:MAG: hypothetical protein B6A08_13555 [Sorangiineae bacterium NIC37A_2]|jgi:hypothetical protein|nr:MAG: hypothetical protein B6A08_13555 [Sorangiineae bacterium NIC37A_2]